jgi:hypothetical protein
MKIDNIVLGLLTMGCGAYFLGRMKRRKEPAKWKHYLTYFIIIDGALLAVSGFFSRHSFW